MRPELCTSSSSPALPILRDQEREADENGMGEDNPPPGYNHPSQPAPSPSYAPSSPHHHLVKVERMEEGEHHVEGNSQLAFKWI